MTDRSFVETREKDVRLYNNNNNNRRMMMRCLVLLWMVTAAATAANHKRLFAYMDTRSSNDDDDNNNQQQQQKRRTHVFALTTTGTLAQRVTGQIDSSWRRWCHHNKNGKNGKCCYSGLLNFTHPGQEKALGDWAVQHRFSLNTLRLQQLPKDNDNNDQLHHYHHHYEPFEDQDYEENLWRLAFEIGGLYLAYNKEPSKHLLHIMDDGDLAALEKKKNDAPGGVISNNIQFQDGFSSGLFVVWTLFNETEAGKRFRFKEWWQKHRITKKYGYEFGNRTEPNGFIRLGQQVCNPPSDCDLPWTELLDKFEETPVVTDIRFSTKPPYGKTDDDLRFLYPGDETILKEGRERYYQESTPPLMYSYTLEHIYLVLPAWLLLAFAPKWKITRLLTLIPIAVHAVQYLLSVYKSATTTDDDSVDLATLGGVYSLFKDSPDILYLHLASDMWLGRWISKDAVMRNVEGFMWNGVVVPVLAFTFLSGPVGWVTYVILLAPLLLPPRGRR